MRNPPSIHTLLPDNFCPLHPNRFPHPRQILRRLLHSVRFAEVEKVRGGAVARAQRSREASAEDVGLPDRRNRHVLGLHLSVPEPFPPDAHAFIALGPRRRTRRHVGLRRSERRTWAFPV